jgi:hypothetical protein
MDKLLLSFDPGRKNFAFSGVSEQGKIIYCGMIEHVINDMSSAKAFNAQLKLLKKEFEQIPIWENTRVIYERFIPRSLNKGNTSEIIMSHIGMVLMKWNLYFIPITASTWKNYFNRNSLWIKNDSLPPHILDSMFISYWYLIKVKKLTIDEVRVCLKKIKHRNFNWYCYRGQWINSNRPVEHKRGRRNSFGN